MNPDTLDDLLANLTNGDAAAAERVFVAYEPYLRKVVRRLLPAQMRSRFDSLDIVQSVWSDLLAGFRDAGWRFAGAPQLRAFLVEMTKNRFIDRYRQTNASLARERTFESVQATRERAIHAGPPAAAQANELWDRLLAACPPEHRELLALKRQGLTNSQVALRTGLHPGSVRRALRELSVRVACGDG